MDKKDLRPESQPPYLKNGSTAAKITQAIGQQKQPELLLHGSTQQRLTAVLNSISFFLCEASRNRTMHV